MKNIFRLMFIGLIALTACETEEVGPVLDDTVAPEITAISETEIVLTQDEAAEMITFEWSEADYGFYAAVTYSLQMDVEGNNFESAITLASTGETSTEVSYGDVNAKLLAAGLAANTALNIEFRVLSIVGSSVEDLVSATSAVTITLFQNEIEYDQLQIPGSYQGWDVANTETVIYSLGNDGIYEGYIYFTEDATEFKFAQDFAWDVNWGDDGADGTLDPSGENIVAEVMGCYKLNADINALTYTTLKTDWGLIGSGTPDNWDADQDMTFDVENNVWTITLDLTAEEIKFRANDDWAINLGDNDTDGSLEQDGANIVVPEDGNYTVTLDLSGPGYTYSVVKN